MHESDDIRGLKLTLDSYVLIFSMKIVVYFYSGVMALLAEVMHIVVQRGLPIEEAERITEAVNHQIHQEDKTGFCVIHVEAARKTNEMPEMMQA